MKNPVYFIVSNIVFWVYMCFRIKSMPKKFKIIVAIAWAILALLAFSTLFDGLIHPFVYIGIFASIGIVLLLSVIYKFILIATTYYKK